MPSVATPSTTPLFPGFPDFQANVTFMPIQFFTVVLPYCSRGCVRIVGYALRQVLGWVDTQGHPTREQLQLSYRQIIDEAGVSRDAIAAALQEALDKRFLRCVQTPQADQRGQPAQSGIYEICWDNEGRYTDSPKEFRGFYYPEAAVMPVPGDPEVIHRPKAARKNIPNAFFDYLLRREPLSVIRVVGALLFYSIQWGPGGERKVPVSRSITDLSRLTKFSRQHVHEAVLAARRRGYLDQVDAGCFDPAAARASRAAIYGIHWSASLPAGKVLRPAAQAVTESPVRNSERGPDRSEKVHGAAVTKGERDQSEKVNGERSEKVNGISIKIEPKTEQATAGVPAANGIAADKAPVAAAVMSGFELLRKAGFDERTARCLAGKRSPEVIQRQMDWLSLRHTTRNRLGLLRRAIEQDWPKPEGATEEASQQLGRLFAGRYYAAYHGYTGEAATEPFPKDIQVAAKFVERLLAHGRDTTSVPEWGRRFGHLLREKHRGDARAKPNLSFAVVLYGDEFLKTVQQDLAVHQKLADGKAREARQAALMPDYLAYLRRLEEKFQRTQPGLYAQFVEHRNRTRHAMSGGLFLASAETLAKFDEEGSRLQAFAEFFLGHPQSPIPDFWQWDERNHPRPLASIPQEVGFKEAHP